MTLAALLAMTGRAGAVEVTPCVAPKPPEGPTVEISGEATVTWSGPAKRGLGRAGVRQRLVTPANDFTGVPTFPVGDISFEDSRSRVALTGAVRLKGRKGRQLTFSGLALVAQGQNRVDLTARFGGANRILFKVGGPGAVRDLEAGTLTVLGGTARLSAAAAKSINRRFALKKKRQRVKAGMKWGRLDIRAVRKVTLPPSDPEAETPTEPPVKARPAGAATIGAASISWRVRESFIRYVNSGTGTWVAEGATAGPALEIDGAAPLVYDFGFPFVSGWDDPSGTVIKGRGAVGFRYCRNTINFAVSNPEIELAGDSDSRMIFRVKGTDGTAFPDSRAVMVQLIPSLGQVSSEGGTTTISGIPGYVPADSTGLFAGFYPPYPGSPDDPNAEFARFGSITVSYTTDP